MPKPLGNRPIGRGPIGPFDDAIINATATQSLAIAQSATAASVSSATASQSLSVAQSATAATASTVSTTQSLGVAQTATSGVAVSNSATQALGVSQSTTVDSRDDATASQGLRISQDVYGLAIRFTDRGVDETIKEFGRQRRREKEERDLAAYLDLENRIIAEALRPFVGRKNAA